METLLKLIDKKEDEILNEEYPYKNKIEYFEDTYENLRKKDKNYYLKIEICDFFAFVVDMLNKDYYENPIIIKNLNNITSDNADELDDVLYFLEQHIEKNGLDDTNLVMPKKIFDNQSIFNNTKDLCLYLAILKDFFPNDLGENDLNIALLGFTMFKENKFEDDELIKEINSHSREIRRYITKGVNFNNTTSYPTIDKLITKLVIHYENYVQEYDNFKRMQKRKCMQLRNIITILKTLLNMPYITITTELNKLIDKDPEIKKEVLRIILEHNEIEFDKVKKENNINKNNSISQLEKLFFDYHINPKLLSSDDRIRLLQNKSIEELKVILEYLKNPLFSFINISNPNFVNILLYSTKDIFEDIQKYYKDGILRQSFLENNIEILIPKNEDINGLFYIFKENIKTLEKYRIKWDELENDELDFILTNPYKLKHILSSLEKYFNPFNQECCYFFLQNPDLINFIDSYIELDLLDLLIEQPEYLTKDEVFKRITILKSINGILLNEKGYILSSILNGKNFYVEDKDLDDYITNHTEYYIDKNAKKELDEKDHFEITNTTLEVDEIINLDQNFKINELMYNFDGIIISRIKVLRNFELLSKGNYNVNNNLFSSIIYNSNLSTDEIEQIKSLLFGKKLQ